MATEINPLAADRYTQTDGTLIISHPEPNIDRGKYHCTAENEFGKVKSRTVTLGFGCEFTGEIRWISKARFGGGIFWRDLNRIRWREIVEGIISHSGNDTPGNLDVLFYSTTSNQ